MARFYTSETLGPKMEKTPEGFLVCYDVPLARTGTQIYGPHETPVAVGPDGIVRVEREAKEVFRPETMASFHGATFVDEHPSEDVTPDNWLQLAAGVVLNPRRGEGASDDVMFGDIKVTRPDTIAKILNGKREISCGYDAAYYETAPGYARQADIIGNHVALVEGGRCGPRCAIGDHKTVKENRNMTIIERIRAAWKSKDETALDQALAELPTKDGVTIINNHTGRTRDSEEEEYDDSEEERDRKDKSKGRDKALDAIASDVRGIKDTVASMDQRLKKVEDKDEDDEEDDDDDDVTRDEEIEFEAEAPPGTNDKAWKGIKDSKPFEASFEQTLALAEIIAPGIAVPTFDSKAKPGKTVDAICGLRRKALDTAYRNDDETKGFLDELLNGRELKSRRCGEVRTLFQAVGTYAKNRNNDSVRRSTTTDHSSAGGVISTATGAVKSVRDWNKRNAEFYKNQ